MTVLVHHPDYVADVASATAQLKSKNGWIRDLAREALPEARWVVPEPMPVRWLEAVHDPDYVAEVLEARVPRTKERRIGFPVTPAVARRAQAVPGGTWRACIEALATGFAANTAGGSHHALAETGAGFCVFNDLAAAAVRLVEEGTVGRVLIVDCDVHQGDGTAALTAGRPEIATYSIHAEKNFPARKARSSLDVPLPDGVDDDGYCAILQDTLTPLVDRFAPELILYQAGVDPFAGDRLGRLALSEAGLARRDMLVADMAIARGLPLASTVGGGYGTDMEAVARRHVATIATLARRLAMAPSGTGGAARE